MTDTRPVLGDPPQSLLLAMEQLISGERSMLEFRDEMLNTIYDQPSTTTAVRGMVDEYARRGLVPEQIHRLLIRDIDKTTDEELPTTPTEFTFSADSTQSVMEETAEVPGLFDDSLVPQPPPEVEEPVVVKRERQPIVVGSLLRGRFEIVGRASGGSMGIVYKAIDRRLAEAEGGQPYVAIKVLAPGYAGHGGAMRALQQEATKGRYLNHPNIVRFLDLDRSDGEIFLVMEWLEGRALSALLNERPGEPVSDEMAWRVIADLARALRHAHQLGVTHADVKPGNIMVMLDGSIKLLDFGISRARGSLAGKTTALDPKILKAATPAYASPDVLQGGAARPVDDVYSLACVAYRLLSGHRVFGDLSALEARQQGLRAKPIEGLDNRRQQALFKALELEQSDRMQTVDEFIDAFELGAGRSTERRPHFGIVAAAVAVIGLLVVLAVLTARLDGTDGAETASIADGSKAVVEAGARAKLLPDPSARRESQSGGQSPPEIPFVVTRADLVDEGRTETKADIVLQLPAEDSVVPAVFAQLRLVEDAGVSRLRLQRVDTTAARRLRLVRQSNGEALSSLLASSLRIDGARDVSFAPGQTEADLTFEHIPDTQPEPDMTVAYTLVDAERGEILARLELLLLDDDRRALEIELPVDSVGFRRSSMSVQEDDVAARIVVWRFNPSSQPVSVAISLQPDSASAGEDFVAPATASVSFAAGETIAMLYLPLVLDDVDEPEEQLTLTLSESARIEGLHRSLTVRILDAL